MSSVEVHPLVLYNAASDSVLSLFVNPAFHDEVDHPYTDLFLLREVPRARDFHHLLPTFLPI